MFRKGNRINRVVFVCFFLVLLLATAACQTTSDEAVSPSISTSGEPIDPSAPTEEPTDQPAPTEEPTVTLEPTVEPTEVPPTLEPTESPPTPAQEPVNLPAARGFQAMAYDSESDRIILFGGELEEFFSNKVSGATWAYDAGNNLWTQMKPTNEPIGVMGPAMAYDSESDRVIMLGGLAENGQFQKKTWAYDYNANTWSEGTTGPEIGAGAEMVYDSESDRIVLFGGWAGSKSLDETWVYDVNTDTWENMEPDNTPPARRWLNMVYDIESDRVILWEGETATTDNVWSYDFNSNTWMEHALDGAPSLENFDGFGAMVYDSESDRSISYGGGLNTGSTFTDAMWVYDYNTDTWTEMVFEDGPGGRTMHRMAYNSALDLIILFGGLENTNHPYSQETWAYDFNTNTWTNMTPEQK